MDVSWPLVGRARELARIEQALRSDAHAIVHPNVAVQPIPVDRLVFTDIISV